MSNLTIATTFIVILNILMWFSQISMLALNPAGSVCYNLEGSLIDNSQTSTGVLSNDVIADLPESQGQVTTDSGNIFTDVFNNILSWFKSAPGVKYIYGVVAAPYNILKCMNLPVEFVAGIGTLWYLVSFLTFLAFLWGRDA